MGAGELGERPGMDVHHTLRKTLQERGSQEVHVPRADDELDIVCLEPVRHRPVARFSIRIVLEREDVGRDARSLGPRQRLCPTRVGGDRRYGEGSVEQCLQVRPLPLTRTPITRARSSR